MPTRSFTDELRNCTVVNLDPADTDLFYRLHGSLLTFANQQLGYLPQEVAPELIHQQPIQQVVKLRDACYGKPELLEQYLLANPDHFPADEMALIASWRHRITGEFYIVRHFKAYTVFLSPEEQSHLYGVLGLYDPVKVVMHGAPLPVLVKATLLPFRDRIIYDGILSPYGISFGPGIRSSISATFSLLKEREGIIEGLVGPDGRPLHRTSLARKAPVKPAPDWRPAVNAIVAQTEKMRETDTRLQGAAFGLLRSAASLAQATLQEQDANNEAALRMKSVRTAMTRLEKLLYERN